MTIKEILKKYNKIEIELLLGHMLKKPKEFLYMFSARELTRMQANRLTRMVKRRLKGEPVAYILGYKDFMGLRFKVNKNVLIPRPETEGMVEQLLSVISNEVRNRLTIENKRLRDPSTPQYFQNKRKYWVGRDDMLRILDVGTGSGAIIISLVHHYHTAAYDSGRKLEFYGSDISEKSLEVAAKNAYHHTCMYDGKIKFIKSDLLKNIKGNFDIIVANLPYLSNEWKKQNLDLKHEPQQALFTKEKGLYLIRKLLEQIASLPHLPKLIYLEFDPRQKSNLSILIKKILPQAEIKFYKDLNKLWRYVEINLDNEHG